MIINVEGKEINIVNSSEGATAIGDDLGSLGSGIYPFLKIAKELSNKIAAENKGQVVENAKNHSFHVLFANGAGVTLKSSPWGQEGLIGISMNICISNTAKTRFGQIKPVSLDSVSKVPTINSKIIAREKESWFKESKTIKLVDKILTEAAVFGDSGQTYEKAVSKIQSELAQMEAMKVENDKITQNEIAKQPEKGHKGWVDACNKRMQDREMMLAWMKECVQFMELFNNTYTEVKDNLTSDNDELIISAFRELKGIYPWDLIKKLGVIKLRTKNRFKMDTPILNMCAGWGNAIANRYNTLKDGVKNVGKSEAQIDGRRKQSANMRARWGAMF